MKVRFTTAARIAELSMKLTWKENILLFIATAITPFVYVAIALFLIAFVIVSGGVMLVAGAYIASYTASAVMAYAGTITYTGMTAACIGSAWLFAKARKTEPRKFFDYLARSGFWYCTSIAAILCFAGFSRFVDAYGWTMAIGALIAAGAMLKLLEFAFRK